MTKTKCSTRLLPLTLMQSRKREIEIKQIQRPRHLWYANTYKDNTNVEGMPTTAGTHLLRNNIAADAFIITQMTKALSF
jgi:amidase